MGKKGNETTNEQMQNRLNEIHASSYRIGSDGDRPYNSSSPSTMSDTNRRTINVKEWEASVCVETGTGPHEAARRTNSITNRFSRSKPRPPSIRQTVNVVNRAATWMRTSTDSGPQSRLVIPNHIANDANLESLLAVHTAGGTMSPTHLAAIQGKKKPGWLNPLYRDNRISTTKYSWLTFLPKNLIEQMHRFANVYFIFIVVLNWVIGAFAPEVSMIPVVFVLAVTAVKDIFEDRRRYLSDKRINNSDCFVYDGVRKEFVKTLWKTVRVGDIVRLRCNDSIPADILLLHSSDEQGMCYIETSNLDGESNLKQRMVVRDTDLEGNPRSSFDPSMFRSRLECDRPSKKLDRFHGKVVATDGSRTAVNIENLLLRDCVIKNTQEVYGLVVYAGHETKTMLNNSGPQNKRSKLEQRMNYDVIWCVVILIVLCFIGAVGSALWQSSFNDPHRVVFFAFSDPKLYNPAYEGFLSFWTFVIILQVLIPISLYVSIEVIKLGQIYHIQNDIELFDPVTNKTVECRALNIPEELGQIQYIFSDKTGTLTENDMVFRRCSIGHSDYNHRSSTSFHSEEFYLSAEANCEVDPERDFSVNFNLSQKVLSVNWSRETLLLSEPGTELNFVKHFLLAMAICNTVVVSRKDSNQENGDANQNVSPVRSRFEAESPDELALVTTACHYGCYLTKRTANKQLTLALPDGSTAELTLLHVLPFDSRRKRMSVVVRCPRTGRIVIYCKGADNSILECSVSTSNELMNNGITLSHLNMYAREGLRTLAIAYKELTIDDYGDWLLFHSEAENTLENREELVHVSAVKMETEMDLLGGTGVEDRLQVGVPECIASLRKAGIVMWVLTGDKQETAIQIAHACRLFSQDMTLIKINAEKAEDAKSLIEQHRVSANQDWAGFDLGSFESIADGHPEQLSAGSFHQRDKRSSGKRLRRCLVIDGKTLNFVLEKELELDFLHLAHYCSAVLCCRVAPLQKAAIVKLVKEQLNVMTLAIGDGANDVSMIQTADVGIGISGNEGRQATMASDFAISKFHFIERLLLVHGHWCYDRLARTVLYFFYKNAGVVFLIFWYQLYCGFSGMGMMEQLNLMLYNLIFNSLPPLVTGVYDQDAPDFILLMNPHLYKQGRYSKVYQPQSFWYNMADALYQSIVIYFIISYTYYDTDVDIWVFGMEMVTACLFAQLLHLCIETKCWTALHVASFLLSLALFFSFNLTYSTVCVSCFPLANPYWVMQYSLAEPNFWLPIALASITAIIPRLVVRSVQTSVKPTPVQKALLSFYDELERNNNIVFQNGGVFNAAPSVHVIEPVTTRPVEIT